MSKASSEEEAIGALESFLRKLYPSHSKLPPPEDAHDIYLEKGRLLVSVDGNSEDYARYPWETYFDWAWRSLVGPLADIVAKGGRPLAFAVDVGIPKGMNLEMLREVSRGLAEAALAHRLFFLGGDTNRAPGSTMWMSIVALGTARREPIPRSGGKLGDGIYTTLVNGYGVPGAMRLAYYQARSREGLLEVVGGLRWRPRAPLQFTDLAVDLEISSSIDSSDGLLKSLLLLSRASGLTVCVDRLPPLDGSLSKVVDAIFSELGVDVVEKMVLEGGEEYEIVFSTGTDEDTVYNKCSNKGLRCMKIGEYCGPGGGRVLYKGMSLSEGGWDNLKSTL